MGYNLGAKSAAIGLLALTGGNRAEAERIWTEIEYADPADIGQALDLIEAALAATEPTQPKAELALVPSDEETVHV